MEEKNIFDKIFGGIDSPVRDVLKPYRMIFWILSLIPMGSLIGGPFAGLFTLIQLGALIVMFIVGWKGLFGGADED